MGQPYTFDEFLTEGPGYWVTEVPPRPLTAAEQQMIEALLTVPFPGNEQLRKQVPSLRVLFHAPPGDLSIKMSPNRDPALAADCGPRDRVPVMATGWDAVGQPATILLHVIEGFIGELEVVGTESLTEWSSLSSPENLQFH
jgi:hypothetical protein